MTPSEPNRCPVKPLPPYLSTHAGTVILALKVQPRASRNAIAAPVGNELRISLTAPPVDDAANAALLRFLSERLNCARHQIAIVRGRTSRHKTLRIIGLTPEAVLAQLSPSP